MKKSLLSTQVKKWFDKSAESEMYASHLYQHIANCMQKEGFFGVQKYFLGESNEEKEHYQKLVDYVNDMGDLLDVPQVPKIKESVFTIGDALELAYETELKLMNQYQEFYEEAEDSGDCITASFLIEFMNIQRKSVGVYGDFISRYEKNKADVFEFDEYMGSKA